MFEDSYVGLETVEAVPQRCCSAPSWGPCPTCQNALDARRSSKWFSRTFGFVEGYQSAGGSVVHLTTPLPKFAVAPGCQHLVDRLLGSARFKQDLVAERTVIKRENLKKVLAKRKADGKRCMPTYQRTGPLAKLRAREWVDKNFEPQFQLECYWRGYLQAVVESWGVFIPRDKKTSGWSYRYPDMLTAETYSKSVFPKFEGEAQRVLPALLSHLLKLFKARLRKRGIRFKSIDTMEVGKKGGYHFHLLIGCLKGVNLAQFETELKSEWHAVSGNVHWFEVKKSSKKSGRKSVKKSWFDRVDSAAGAARYVSKYVSKSHFPDTRVRSSQFLYLAQYERDAALIRSGVLREADLSAG